MPVRYRAEYRRRTLHAGKACGGVFKSCLGSKINTDATSLHVQTLNEGKHPMSHCWERANSPTCCLTVIMIFYFGLNYEAIFGTRRSSHYLSLHCVSPLFMVVQRKTFCVPVMSLHLVNTGLSQALLPASDRCLRSHGKLIT